MTDFPSISFQELSSIALSLNKASDEFTKLVGRLERDLQEMNIGIVVWVTVRKFSNGNEYLTEQIGYAKVEGNWRIAIRTTTGDEKSEYPDIVGNLWAFNDAPRDMRLRGVEKLPDLIISLAKAAVKTTELVNKKLAETRTFAESVGLGLEHDKFGNRVVRK